METYKVGAITPDGFEVLAVNQKPVYKLRRRIRITNPNYAAVGELAYYYIENGFEWVELDNGQRLKLLANEFEYVDQFKPATLFTLVQQQLVALGFNQQKYKMSSTALELETVHYVNQQYHVYLHLYGQSVRFAVQEADDTHSFVFEIYQDKYTLNRRFGHTVRSEYFDTLCQVCLDYVKPMDQVVIA